MDLGIQYCDITLGLGLIVLNIFLEKILTQYLDRKLGLVDRHNSLESFVKRLDCIYFIKC